MAFHANDETQLIGDTSYRSQMEEIITVPALRVGPRSITGEVIKVLHGSSFIRRGIRHCIDDDANANPNTTMGAGSSNSAADTASSVSDCRICLLEPGVNVEELMAKIGAHFEAINKNSSDDVAAASSSSDATKKKKQAPAREISILEPCTKQVQFTYKNFTMPEILRKVLPKGVVALSGFEQVGHIAHVNLDESHLPFQFIIGQVILDCNDTVRTVVNKVGSIDSVFREFKMECIGGDPTAMTAEVKQYGITFTIPYDKVYWNSRLSFEHHRLVSEMNAGDQLFDVMAGCGPFAIPAAQKGIIVYANDLNPESVKAMRINADRNGVKQGKDIYCYEMDGREFIEKVVREQFLETFATPAAVSDAIVAKGKAYDKQFAVLSAADKKCGKKNGPSSSAIVNEIANNNAT